MAEKNRNFLSVLVPIGAGSLLLYFLLKKKDESGGTSESEVNYDPKNLTYSDLEYKTIADAVETYVFGSGGLVSFTEDDAAIGNALKLMFTFDDVAKLIETYGRRYVGVFISEGGNLVQTISEYLDDDVKNSVNATYQARGINFFWP